MSDYLYDSGDGCYQLWSESEYDTMIVPQKHCALSFPKPSYAVPNNSKNGTHVFSNQNLWLEFCRTLKPVVILVESATVVEAMLVTFQAIPKPSETNIWAGCWYTHDTWKYPF
jgi:hypothetical protein